VFYIALAALALLALIIVLIIARAQLNLWAARPVVHTNLVLEQVAPLIRSWGPWLEERGRIVVRHAENDVEVELRKRRFSTRPDALIVRVRNADANKKHFDTIRGALDDAHVPYELERTRKKGQPRAIEVPLAAEDIHTPAAAQRLIETVFRDTAGFQVHCEGRMRRLPDVPRVPLLPWNQGHAAGWQFGQKLGRTVRRLFG